MSMRGLLFAVSATLMSGACASAVAAEAWDAEGFSVEALAEAAKGEPPITIYDSTGKIVDMAEAFSKKYGITATGVKVSAASQLEMIIREARSGNVQGDVALITDTPAAVAQLLPSQFVTSWMPPDMVDHVDARFREPLAISTNANVWAYNSQAHDKCPVTNIWQLTEPEHSRRIALVDPLTKPSYADWFNQMETYADEAVAKAYEAQYGKPLETGEESATAAWVKALAANSPLLSDGDDGVSEAIGTPDQKEPFFGLLSSAKFRDNAESGRVLALCTEMEPWAGWSYTKLALVATGTDSPNAARLFIHYVMTEEGIMPQMVDGKIPTNSTIAMPADEPSGLMAVSDKVFGYDAASALDDWDARQTWQDLWRLNYKR